MRKFFETGDEESPEALPSKPPRNRILPGRNFAREHLPNQVCAAQGCTDPQVFGIAAETYLAVIDPATNKPWNGVSVTTLAPTVFTSQITRCQQEALNLSAEEDSRAQQQVKTAEEAVSSAEEEIRKAEAVLDTLVEDGSGAQCPGREALAAYQADRELARQREQAGDTTHLERPFDNAWIVIGSIVFAFLDMLLFWRPILALGPLDESGMLLRWVIAGFFIAAQALFIAMILRYYRDRERGSRDRRDAVKDHNRAVRHDVGEGDLFAAGRPTPDLDSLRHADRKLSTAQDWLVAAAILLGVIGAVRVALLTARSGHSLVEATLFGAIIGLILGGLVLLLGWVSCRGNRLGDRLRAGARVAADLDAEVELRRGEASTHSARAHAALHDAAAARGDAEDTRDWVTCTYRQALLLACQWFAHPPPRPDQLTDELTPRQLRTAADVQHRITGLTSRLTTTDHWLATESAVSTQIRTTTDLVVAEPGRSGRFRTVPPPADGEPGGVIGFELAVPQQPTPSRWLILVGAALAVLAAFTAAAFMPEREDDSSQVRAATTVTTGADLSVDHPEPLAFTPQPAG